MHIYGNFSASIRDIVILFPSVSNILLCCWNKWLFVLLESVLQYSNNNVYLKLIKNVSCHCRHGKKIRDSKHFMANFYSIYLIFFKDIIVRESLFYIFPNWDKCWALLIKVSKYSFLLWLLVKWPKFVTRYEYEYEKIIAAKWMGRGIRPLKCYYPHSKTAFYHDSRQ